MLISGVQRVWLVVEMFDLVLSFRVGLPPIIDEDQTDCELPRNLFDEDFDELCEVLPPSRSSKDPTPMLCF